MSVSRLSGNSTDDQQIIICNMGEGIIDNSAAKIATFSVATCIMVVVYHPQTNFCLLAHIFELNNDVIAEQNRFIQILEKQQIPLQEVKIYLAGGQRSDYSSTANAAKILQFWTTLLIQKKISSLNQQYLFARDCIVIPEAEFSKLLLENCPPELKSNVEGHIQTKCIYHFTRDTGPAGVFIKERLKSYCTRRQLVEEAALDTMIIKRNTNPTNPKESKISVLGSDPKKCFFLVIGFDKQKQELFIIDRYEDESYPQMLQERDSAKTRKANCDDRILVKKNYDTLILDLSQPKVNAATIKPTSTILTAIKQTSPVHVAGNSHDLLLADIRQLIPNKNNSYFKRFIELIEERKYGAALRSVCNSDENHELASQLVNAMLTHKDSLSIDINEKPKNLTAYGYAQLKKNVQICKLLEKFQPAEVSAQSVLENKSDTPNSGLS